MAKHRGYQNRPEQPRAEAPRPSLRTAPSAGGPPLGNPKSWEIDPLDPQTLTGEQLLGTLHPGTAGLDYDTLRMMSRVSPIAPVVDLCVSQIAEYMVPQTNPYVPGYVIRLRDRKQTPTEASKKRASELSRLLNTCGDPRIQRDTTLEGWARKVFRDSFTYDQACCEFIPTRGGKFAGFVAVDASTIRRAALAPADRQVGRRTAASEGYVQIINAQVKERFTADEFLFGIRRPRTWIKVNGYGFPELELLVRTITAIVNFEVYNEAAFTHGIHAAGILAMKSKMAPELFRAFKREFYAMLSGAQNAKKTALVQLDPENKEELQNINLSQSAKEMEFPSWASYNLRKVCMAFGKDPAELGYQYGNEGQRQSLQGAGVSEKIKASRERTTRPTLRIAKNWLDRPVQLWDADFEIAFGPETDESEKQKLDNLVQAVQHGMTVNEARKYYLDLERVDNPLADMILNPTYVNSAMQLLQQAAAEAQQAQQQGAAPDPNDDSANNFDFDSLFGTPDGGSPPPPEEGMPPQPAPAGPPGAPPQPPGANPPPGRPPAPGVPPQLAKAFVRAFTPRRVVVEV